MKRLFLTLTMALMLCHININAKDASLINAQRAAMKAVFEIANEPELKIESIDNGLRVVMTIEGEMPDDNTLQSNLTSLKTKTARSVGQIMNLKSLAESGFELELCARPKGVGKSSTIVMMGDSWIANGIEAEAAPSVDMSAVEGINIYDNQIPSDLPLAKDLRQKPKYPGGANAMLMWIVDNMVYPQSAMERNMQGVVQVDFIIETDGTITHPYVSQPLDPDLDREAMRLVKMMPKWTPAANGDDIPVRCRHTLPISFIFETM